MDGEQARRLPGEWVEKAKILFKDAQRHLEEGHYWLTCFEAVAGGRALPKGPARCRYWDASIHA